MTLGVLSQEFAGGIEMGVFPDAGEDVEDLASIWACILDTIGRNDGQGKLSRQIAQSLIDAIFASQEMALDLDVHVFAAKGVDWKLRPVSGNGSRTGKDRD